MAPSTAKETTIEEKLKALYELQKIDSKIQEFKTLRGELPIEVSELEDEIAGLEHRVQRIQEEEKEIKTTISGYKTNIKTAEEAIVKYEGQQMNVKNNREYDALTKEVELQKLEIQLNEKRIREAQAGSEEKKILLARTQENIENKRKELVEKKAELTKIIEETEKEEGEIEKISQKAQENIEERLLVAYHRIRNNYKNGLAVVKIERGACGGCFATIPPQRQVEVKQRKKVIVCEHCGRILVDSEIDA